MTKTRVRSGCNGKGACGLCRVRIGNGPVNEPTDRELQILSVDQRKRGERLACQVIPDGDVIVEILSPAPESAWRSLPSGQIYQIRGDRGAFSKGKNELYGVAVDIGTTQLSISLVSLKTGNRVASRYRRNPQGDFGMDVMSRLISAADSNVSAEEMSNAVLTAIGDGIRDIVLREGIDIRKIKRVALVGNTAMLALLTGENYELLISPQSWMKTISCTPKETDSWKTMWAIPVDSVVDVIQPAGGFVGSDMLAGVLATRITEHSASGLFIDFGTNSEIVLWNGMTLYTTSVAGGPAFEGCGIQYGMPADPGAIYRIRISNEHAEFGTLDGAPARGFCGTGIVDLVAGLVGSGFLNEKGQFLPPFHNDGYTVPGTEPPITFSKHDVDVFQRAKAAIGTGIQALMKEAGMRRFDFDRIFVGGTFGTSLDTGNATRIGLLPPVPPDRIELCGNTALAGCEWALLSQPAHASLDRMRKDIHLINLASYENFDDFYLENLYIRPMEVP